MLKLLALLLLSACGCGDDAPGGPDGGVDGDDGATRTPTAPALPAPPMPVEAPRLTAWDCPGGWRAIDIEGVIACDPYPASGVASCDPFEAHLPGEPGCVRLDTACSASFPSAPSDAFFVDASATAAGVGTRESPFQAVGEAIDAAPAGATIAIAPGTYAEQLTISRSVTLIGACAERAILSATSGESVHVTAGDVTVRGLAITGLRANGGRLDVESSALEASSVPALVIEGASTVAHLREVLVRGGAVANVGVLARSGATLELERVLVRNAQGNGVEASGASVTLRDAVITTISPASDDTRRMMYAHDGATMTVERVALLGVAAVTMPSRPTVGRVATVRDPGTTMTVTDLFARGVDAPDQRGAGFSVIAGGTLRGRRIRFERLRHNAVGLNGMGSLAELEDVAVADVGRFNDDQPFGAAASVDAASRLVLKRALIDGYYRWALTAQAENARLEVEDAIVRDGRVGDPADDPALIANAPAAILSNMASFKLVRVLVQRFGPRGLRVLDSDAEVEDLAIEDAVPTGWLEALGTDGLAIETARTRGTYSRVRVRGAGAAALLALDATVTFDDFDIEDTRTEMRGAGGGGIAVGGVGTLTLHRTRVRGALFIAVGTFAREAEIEASDLEIVGARSIPAESPGLEFGYAALAFIGSMRLERARITDFGNGGLTAIASGRIEATDLTIANSHAVALSYGRCIDIEQRSFARIERADLSDCRGVGVLAYDRGWLELSDLRVRGTRIGCDDDGCTRDAFGFGVYALDEAQVKLERFDIAEHALCGVSVDAMSTVDLAHGVVHDNPIGVCVEGMSPPAVDVRFDNVQNLAAQMLPVPDPAIAPPELTTE